MTTTQRFAPRSLSAALLAALVMAAAFWAIPLTGPAGAASGDYGTVGGANQRWCPDTRCGVRNYIPSGTSVPVWCWRDAGWALGTPRWFRVRYNGVDAWVNAGTMTRQPSVPYCSDMRPGEVLFAGQTVWSGNGAYRLTMQTDGNAVMYSGSGAMWSTRTCCQSGARLAMQTDGNLVVYNSGGGAVWSSGTYGNPGAWLAVQSDSNMVLYGRVPLYASNWYRTWGTTRSYNGAYDRGQCTYWAYERFRQSSGVYPALFGDAHYWNDSAAARGWRVLGSPATHSIVVFEPYVQGSGALGHVAWVDMFQARSDGLWIHITEMNFRGWGVVSDRWIRHGSGMSYVMAPSL